MESEKNKLEEQRKIAEAYARYLKEHQLKPGDATFLEPEDLGLEEETMQEIDVIEDEERKEISEKYEKAYEKIESLGDALSAPLFWFDDIADKSADAFHHFGEETVTATHKIVSVYTASKKVIATAVFIVCLLSAIMLVLFDKFTVYEYAYNGKVLGYVSEQEEVTNVLEVAGDELNQVNTDNNQEIKFVANDNISFKRVMASGKDRDDADTTVNKLAFMTDIEVDASAIYDGDKLVTIVKDKESAERLLVEVKAILGTPDEGMDVISAEFVNPLDIKDVNVLLTSVQSYSAAKEQMVNGGNTKFYHLVEDEETINTIANDFGVSVIDIYDQDNNANPKFLERGDKVCIHKNVTPVNVELVEQGKLKETVPFETVEEKSNKYYIGDRIVKREGVNGVQIIDGTITKVSGKETNRDIDSIDVLTEKVDELVIIGTNKKPRTAPTGIFKDPLDRDTYVITSRPGWRWGRTHEGIDMGVAQGTKVHASDGGEVVRAEWYGGYGNCIDIKHDDGWISRYGHLSGYEVKVGDKVYQGQVIGYTGNTGRSTGPHLHFELRKNDSFVDPDTMVEGGL